MEIRCQSRSPSSSLDASGSNALTTLFCAFSPEPGPVCLTFLPPNDGERRRQRERDSLSPSALPLPASACAALSAPNVPRDEESRAGDGGSQTAGERKEGREEEAMKKEKAREENKITSLPTHSA